jgi:hypothetical protein
MDFFDFSFWHNFGSDLLATLFGVIIGIPIAFWVNRRIEARTVREKNYVMFNSLYWELDRNLKLIVEWQANNELGVPKRMYGALLQDEVWNAFSDSGEIHWAKAFPLIASLTDVYGRIKRIKYLYDSYLYFKPTDWIPQSVIHNELIIAVEEARVSVDEVKDLLGWLLERY